jgi:acetyltransferase-like isoleucine patch superfamily enzyme
VKIGLGKHPSKKFVSTYPAFYNPDSKVGPIQTDKLKFQEFSPVKIGNDVWIGDRVLILDGVTIGDGAIIGAGAVVTKDVEPYSISVGIPAKPVRKRFTDEQISFLLKFRWWDKEESWIHDNMDLFDDIDAMMNGYKKQ